MAAREPQPTLATFRKGEGKHQQWLLAGIGATRCDTGHPLVLVCAERDRGEGILNQQAHVTSGAARQPTR